MQSVTFGSAVTVRVMTLNLCVEGPARGKDGAETWANLILRSGASIVGVQEVLDYKHAVMDHPANEGDYSFLIKLVEKLEWNLVNFDLRNNTAVISCFPTHEGKVTLPNGQEITPLSIHLPDSPYQVGQLTGLNYGDGAPPLSTGEEAAESALKNRTHYVARLLDSLEDPCNTLIMGDFNEPSHLDWTDDAHRQQLCPVPVAWPTTGCFEENGFVDCFRAIHEDSTAELGYTYPAPSWHDVHGMSCRIDYIFARNKPIEDAGMFPEGPDDKWPSDHLGVWADIVFGVPKSIPESDSHSAYDVSL